YYTPSGRSIHKPSNGRDADISVMIGGRSLSLFDVLGTIRDAGSRTAVAQSLIDRFNLTQTDVETLLGMDLAHLADQIIETDGASDTVAQKDRKFTTVSGRTVYGGGGILPDVIVEQDIPRFAEQLERRRLFFSFAVHYVAVHPEIRMVGQVHGLTVDDRTIEEFKAFITDPTKAFDYESAGEQELKSLKEVAEQESGYGPGTSELIRKLSQELALKDSLDFQESLPYINGAIKREIASRLWGSEEQIRAGFALDAQLKAAVAILNDPALYAEKMKGTAVVVRK
ncbi:MAG: hypothetical protein HY709_03375, partial [Candidatus Latescibacteria bacterium]|nr:hypothetical protein [Candidatus Latescibacterota bacterium]